MMGRQSGDPFASFIKNSIYTGRQGQRQEHKQGQAMVEAGGRQTVSGQRQRSGQAANKHSPVHRQGSGQAAENHKE